MGFMFYMMKTIQIGNSTALTDINQILTVHKFIGMFCQFFIKYPLCVLI